MADPAATGCGAGRYPTFEQLPDAAEVSAQALGTRISVRIRPTGAGPGGAVAPWVTVSVDTAGGHPVEPTSQRMITVGGHEVSAVAAEAEHPSPTGDGTVVSRQLYWSADDLALELISLDVPWEDIDRLLGALKLEGAEEFDAFLASHGAPPVC